MPVIRIHSSTLERAGIFSAFSSALKCQLPGELPGGATDVLYAPAPALFPYLLHLHCTLSPPEHLSPMQLFICVPEGLYAH